MRNLELQSEMQREIAEWVVSRHRRHQRCLTASVSRTMDLDRFLNFRIDWNWLQ